MRQLNFDLKTLQARHREGAFNTRRDRPYALNQAANLLHALGFRRLVPLEPAAFPPPTLVLVAVAECVWYMRSGSTPALA